MLPRIYPLFTLIIAVVWFLADPSFEPFLQALLLAGALFSTGVQVSSQYTGSVAYLAGRRIRFLRKHLGISQSQLAELLEDFSELEIVNLEKGRAEASPELLKKLNRFTGASIEWLKHGSMKDHVYGYLHSHCFPALFFTGLWKVLPRPEFVPFPRKDCTYFEPEQTRKIVSALRKLPTAQLTVSVDPSEWSQVFLLVDRSQYRTDIWDLNALDFWHSGWIGEHHHLPAVLDFFQQLSELYPDIPIKGCFLKRKELQALGSGLTSPCNEQMSRKIALGQRSSDQYKNVTGWPIDLVDIHHRQGGAEHYQDWYGERFVEIQMFFERHTNR